MVHLSYVPKLIDYISIRKRRKQVNRTVPRAFCTTWCGWRNESMVIITYMAHLVNIMYYNSTVIIIYFTRIAHHEEIIIMDLAHIVLHKGVVVIIIMPSVVIVIMRSAHIVVNVGW